MNRPLTRRDQNDLYEYLMQNEPMNATMLTALSTVGITARATVLRSGDHYGFYPGDSQTLGGALGLYNNSQCAVSLTDPACAGEVAQFLTRYPSRTVFGEARGMHPVAAALRGGAYSVPVLQHYMTLKSPARLPQPRSSLTFRDVSRRPGDKEAVVFISRCLQDCFGFDTRVDVVARVLRERQRQETYYVVYENDEPIGQVHIQAFSPHYMQIGGVAILPRARGRGLGAEVVSQIAGDIFARRATPSLLVDADNDTAVRLYDRLGFQKAGEMLLLRR